MKQLTKDELRKIVGGLTCVNLSCNQVTPPAGSCTVSGGPGRCCWAAC